MRLNWFSLGWCTGSPANIRSNPCLLALRRVCIHKCDVNAHDIRSLLDYQKQAVNSGYLKVIFFRNALRELYDGLYLIVLLCAPFLAIILWYRLFFTFTWNGYNWLLIMKITLERPIRSATYAGIRRLSKTYIRVRLSPRKPRRRRNCA